jgi:hypothetical protein
MGTGGLFVGGQVVSRAVRLIFLQRVGGGYRFVHGSLMEHIAGRGDRGTNSVGTVSSAGRS